MLLWRAMWFVLIEQVVTAPITPTDSSDTSVVRERYKPGVHIINNANPYQGATVTKGHSKYPVIVEPLQNVQTSCSTYKVTSFIDFTLYLEYFQQFKRYLEAFKTSMKAFKSDPILQEFQEMAMATTSDKTGEKCRYHCICFLQPLLYQLRSPHASIIAYQRQHQCCITGHIQACMALRQFEYMLNVTEYVNENYLRLKEKFLRAIDYVENINISGVSLTDSMPRQKRDIKNQIAVGITPQEEKYLLQLLTELVPWNPSNSITGKKKRFILQRIFLFYVMQPSYRTSKSLN